MSDLDKQPQVVRGNPTPAELAAAIAVLEAAAIEEASLAGSNQTKPKSTWNRNSVNLRGGINPGFGQWKASFRDGLN
jgi:hypothetical protein